MGRFLLILLAGGSALFSHHARAADNPSSGATEDFARVVVTGKAETDSLTAPSFAEAANQKTEIPGGFTLRTAEEMQRGRASNFEDLLQRAPGVLLQTDNGTEVTRVSIRGSGILSEDEPLGVQFLLDGLTLNQADGEVILEDFDLATVKYAEVFRGADALKYGSITLGGAINLVTLTGYDAPPFQTRIEAGSFGYFRGEVSYGGVSGPLDYVGSLMGRTRDGFREHSAENLERIFGDVGYKVSDNLENRFYVTFDHLDRQLPGGLTKEELKEDPEQAAADAIVQDFNKQWDFVRLADKISFRSEDYDFDGGLFWFHRNLEERGFFSPDFREGITAFYSDNYGASFNFVARGELFGRRNTFTAGFSPQFEREVSQNFENLDGQRGQTTALNTTIAINAPLYLEERHYLTRNLSIVAAMQFVYARRDFADHFLSDDDGDQSHTQDFYGWNPKAGLIYEIDKAGQLFLNFSESWQPPSFNNMVEFGEGPNSSIIYRPLEPQRARTLELGTRGIRGRFEWELSLYRAWLRNELLELNDAKGNDLGAINVDRSYHQGIEANLDIELLDSVFLPGSKQGDGSGDGLMFSQSYVLNDFHFDDDAVYGRNRIAGVPIHFYEAELLYVTDAGFYAGPNVRWNATRYPVDQANTLSVDPYALLGFKIGFRPKKGFSIFFEAKNLTNKRFASAVDPIADAQITVETPQIFHPGDGRAYYGGISWNW